MSRYDDDALARVEGADRLSEHNELYTKVSQSGPDGDAKSAVLTVLDMHRPEEIEHVGYKGNEKCYMISHMCFGGHPSITNYPCEEVFRIGKLYGINLQRENRVEDDFEERDDLDPHKEWYEWSIENREKERAANAAALAEKEKYPFRAGARI